MKACIATENHDNSLPNVQPYLLDPAVIAHCFMLNSSIITSLSELFMLLDLPSSPLETYTPKRFPLRVPRSFVDKMEIGNPDDPLLRQVLPMALEQQTVLGYDHDPLDESQANPALGVIHKYRNRLLLTLTGACSIHCRYCFRQHFDYQANLPRARDWQRIREHITAHPEVTEVILSGGDPLTLNNRQLFAAMTELERLPQLLTLRLHSRTAITTPERLDDELLERLITTRLRIVLVVHSNHPNEIDDAMVQLYQRWLAAGITLLNQSVLLRGINDDVETLAALSERLFTAGVLPYYLHLLDKVAGAAHFDVPETEAVVLYWQLMARLPGYLLPKLVRELPGFPHKMPVDIYAQQADRPGKVAESSHSS